MTEYGVLQKHYYINTDSDGVRYEDITYHDNGTIASAPTGKKSPYLRQSRLTALRAFDTISHIVFGVNNDWVDMLQYFNWGLGNFGYSRMTNFDQDFKHVHNKIDPSTYDPPRDLMSFKVNANGQIFAHVAGRALRSTLQSGVDIDTSTARLSIKATSLGNADFDTCIKAAAFKNTTSMSFVILNRCNFAIPSEIDFSSLVPEGSGQDHNVGVWTYVGDDSAYRDEPWFVDYGEYVEIPVEADGPYDYPWSMHPYKNLAGARNHTLMMLTNPQARLVTLELPPLSLTLPSIDM